MRLPGGDLTLGAGRGSGDRVAVVLVSDTAITGRSPKGCGSGATALLVVHALSILLLLQLLFHERDRFSGGICLLGGLLVCRWSFRMPIRLRRRLHAAVLADARGTRSTREASSGYSQGRMGYIGEKSTRAMRPSQISATLVPAGGRWFTLGRSSSESEPSAARAPGDTSGDRLSTPPSR